MKINLSDIDTDFFNLKEQTIAGDKCYLVNPKNFNVHWNKDNLIFRSSIWNEQGKPVSLSFKKFFNWEEQKELVPFPNSTKNCSLIEKIDGSLIIISKYKNQIIHRTRGTFDASNLENGSEVEYLKQKYPKAFNSDFIGTFSTQSIGGTRNFSLLLEWTTPTNRIVLDYGTEPKLFLVGLIWHDDYSYMSQKCLDDVAKILEVERPKRFSFDTIEQMISAVEIFEGVEGICVYFNNDQEIKKLKSITYLAQHAFKNNASIKNILDIWIEINQPNYTEFVNYIQSKFDYECLQMALPHISKVCDASKEMNKIIEHMKNFIVKLDSKIRKDQAIEILDKYKKNSGMVFTLLDGKELTKDQVKKLMYQCLGETE